MVTHGDSANGSVNGSTPEKSPSQSDGPRYALSLGGVTVTGMQYEPSSGLPEPEMDSRSGGQSSTGISRELSFDTERGPVTCPEFVGEYQVIGLIGRGGMGNVFRVRNPFFNFEQALKMLDARLDSREARRQFIAEMRTQAELEHTNVAKVHYAGVCRAKGKFHDQLYFVMSLESGDLDDEIKKRGSYPPAEAANVVRRLAKAIGLAHARGTFHCDLKPKNILIGSDGTPKITDFGLAKMLAETQDARAGRCGAFGTPSYMPPEQADGAFDRVDARSDVYGLGAILYELLTGKPPYNGKTRDEVLWQVKNEKTPPESIRKINPRVPARLEQICLKCLEKNPAKRYATAAELEEELDLHLRPRWIRRHWKPLAVVAGFLALLATVGTLGYRQYAAPREDARKDLELAANAAHDDDRIKHLKAAVARFDQVLAENGVVDRDALRIERDLAAATAWTVQAEAHVERREYADAKKALAEAHAVLGGDGTSHRLQLAEIHHVEGNYHADQDHWADAIRSYERGRDIRLEIVLPEDHPEYRHLLRDLARSHGYLGDAQTRTHRVADAKASYTEARKLRAKLAESGKDEDVLFHARDDGNFAELAEWQGPGHVEEALIHRRNRVAYYRDRLGHLSTLPPHHRTERTETLTGLVELLLDLPDESGPLVEARFREARQSLDRAGEEFRALGELGVASDPKVVASQARWRLALARYELVWSRATYRPARYEDTHRYLEAAERAYRTLDREKKANTDDYYNWAAVLALKGRLETDAAGNDRARIGQFILALDRLEKAREMGFCKVERLKRDNAFAALRLDANLNPALQDIVARLERANPKPNGASR
jgi:serine/threonine protein kinase